MDKISSYCVLMLALFAIVLFSCNKDDDGLPTSDEPISFLAPDSTTVFAQAGSEFNYTVFLVTDKPILSLSAGYLIDVTQNTASINFGQLEEIILEQEFEEENNVIEFSGSFTIPAAINDSTPFRSYMPQQQNPVFVPASYDAVRVLFRMDASGTIYEKQLKIIIQ